MIAAHLAEVAAQRTPPRTFKELGQALDLCRACPLWAGATQGVGGEGPARAALMIVGEQPGDQENLAGKPFVGPAGKMLDKALAAANIERGETYVTNAVKHFKNEPRGKRRLHQRPTRGETEICRWWLSQEIARVGPKLIVALGATAAYGVMGHKTALGPIRGQVLRSREGVPALATAHPSLLLRQREAAEREREFKALVSDLKKARTALAALH